MMPTKTDDRLHRLPLFGSPSPSLSLVRGREAGRKEHATHYSGFMAGESRVEELEAGARRSKENRRRGPAKEEEKKSGEKRGEKKKKRRETERERFLSFSSPSLGCIIAVSEEE